MQGNQSHQFVAFLAYIDKRNRRHGSLSWVGAVHQVELCLVRKSNQCMTLMCAVIDETPKCATLLSYFRESKAVALEILIPI